MLPIKTLASCSNIGRGCPTFWSRCAFLLRIFSSILWNKRPAETFALFSQIVLTLVVVVPHSLPALSWICLQTKRCKSLSVLTCLPTLHLLSSPATQKREPRKNWVQKYSEHSSFLWFIGNIFNLFFLFWKSSGTQLFHPLYCKILTRDYLPESYLQCCLCK